MGSVPLFPLLLFSASSFFCREFSLERTNERTKRPRDIDVPSSPPSAMAQGCRRRCFRVSCEESLLLLLLFLVSYRSSILFVSPIPMQETVSNSANKGSPSPPFPNPLYPLCPVYSCCSCCLGFIMSNDIRQYDVIAGRILNFPLEKSWIKNVRRVSNIFLRSRGTVYRSKILLLIRNNLTSLRKAEKKKSTNLRIRNAEISYKMVKTRRDCGK